MQTLPAPEVSVIVPNYNHLQFLPKRIDSILKQTFRDFEVILLDDCSTDGSRSILSSFAADPRVRIEFNTVNSGSSFKQWNKGVRLARGKYVWIAESDDYADERLLERLVAAVESDPKVAFAYCLSWGIRADGTADGFADRYLGHLSHGRWRADFVVDGREECETYFVRTNVVPNASAVVFRRAVYESVGGADESLRMCGDWKLWAAMALTGKVAYIGKPLNFFRFHGASVRTRSERDGRNVVEYLRVIRWILSQVTPAGAILEEIYNSEASRWVPALMSLHVPLRLKLEILKNVRAIDPHPVRRTLRPFFATVWLKFGRHFQFVRQKTEQPQNLNVDEQGGRHNFD
jgi:glycosyltransferase involved in cell wall biosynthesis